MNIKSRSGVLLFDSIIFLLLGIAIWAINIFAQGIFPGNNQFAQIIRWTILLFTALFCYYLNYRFSRKNQLNVNTLKFSPGFIKHCLGGVVLGCLLIVIIWAAVYVVYPFTIISNSHSKLNLAADFISYTLGNTLEELLFRGFLLLASAKMLGKVGGVFLVSFLFGLFHLQGTGLTVQGLSMVITTFTMSLLFISVIYFTSSIWTAVTLHITGNFLLHTLGFDGTDNGTLQIIFSRSNINGLILTLIFEIVVTAIAIVIFLKGRKQIQM